MEKTKRFYINLCSNTPEIQKLWKPAIADYYYRKSDDKVYLLTKKKVINRKDCVWLPTEKQLYEKIARHYGTLNWRDFDKNAAEVYAVYLQEVKDYPSKEICGLGGIMYFHFQKVWRDGEWR